MKKIVMIEDNEDHALLIQQAIKNNEYVIQHYHDGMAAIQELEGIKVQTDAPDLVLLDLKLPGMDGCEVLKRIRNIKVLERTPVVMVTTSGRREEIERAYQAGAWGYVIKSEDFAELSEKLKCVIKYWLKTVEPAKAPASKT